RLGVVPSLPHRHHAFTVRGFPVRAEPTPVPGGSMFPPRNRHSSNPDNNPSAAGPVSRRGFLGGMAGVGAGAVLLGAGTAAGPAAAAPSRRVTDPFQLGLASGDPLPDGVVLWTRLAPKPLDFDGGMPGRIVPVQWEIALD